MAKIYTLNFEKCYGETLNDLGYSQITNSLYVKEVMLDYNDEKIQALLNKYYKNENWYFEIYPKIKDQLALLGIKYTDNGKLIEDEEFKKLMCTWLIEIDLDDFWIGLGPSDPNIVIAWYATTVLDKHCKDEIEMLLANDFIVETEVTQ